MLICSKYCRVLDYRLEKNINIYNYILLLESIITIILLEAMILTYVQILLALFVG